RHDDARGNDEARSEARRVGRDQSLDVDDGALEPVNERGLRGVLRQTGAGPPRDDERKRRDGAADRSSHPNLPDSGLSRFLVARFSGNRAGGSTTNGGNG